MNDVTPIEMRIPHETSEVICIGCGKRWTAVRPVGTRLKDLQCVNCGAGKVIETGEKIFDERCSHDT